MIHAHVCNERQDINMFYTFIDLGRDWIFMNPTIISLPLKLGMIGSTKWVSYFLYSSF